MKLITGNLWGELGHARIIFVTTNAYINKSGELVMGRGAALEAKKRFPNLPQELAERIQQKKDPKQYGIAFSRSWEKGTLIGAFQVKDHFRDKADLALIRDSCESVVMLAQCLDRIAMNFPGIGYGGRTIEEVLPILQILPDNVFVYQKEGV